MRWAALFACGLGLLGCDEPGRQLSASELQAALSTSQTVRFRSFRSLRIAGHADLNADQSAHLVIPALGEDTGRWWLEGDKVCSEWTQAMDSREICVFVFERADDSYSATHAITGKPMGHFSLEPKS